MDPFYHNSAYYIFNYVGKLFEKYEWKNLIDMYYHERLQNTQMMNKCLNPRYELYVNTVHANLEFLKAIVTKYDNILMRDDVLQFITFV